MSSGDAEIKEAVKLARLKSRVKEKAKTYRWVIHHVVRVDGDGSFHAPRSLDSEGRDGSGRKHPRRVSKGTEGYAGCDNPVQFELRNSDAECRVIEQGYGETFTFQGTLYGFDLTGEEPWIDIGRWHRMTDTWLDWERSGTYEDDAVRNEDWFKKREEYRCLDIEACHEEASEEARYLVEEETERLLRIEENKRRMGLT